MAIGRTYSQGGRPASFQEENVIARLGRWPGD
nr:hypothetical protein I308_05153 [Cryptococcus tetragattii IND107]